MEPSRKRSWPGGCGLPTPAADSCAERATRCWGFHAPSLLHWFPLQPAEPSLGGINTGCSSSVPPWALRCLWCPAQGRTKYAWIRPQVYFESLFFCVLSLVKGCKLSADQPVTVVSTLKAVFSPNFPADSFVFFICPRFVPSPQYTEGEFHCLLCSQH